MVLDKVPGHAVAQDLPVFGAPGRRIVQLGELQFSRMRRNLSGALAESQGGNEQEKAHSNKRPQFLLVLDPALLTVAISSRRVSPGSLYASAEGPAVS